MAFVACFDDACSKIKYVGLYWFVNASVMTSRMKQIFHRVCRLGSRYSCISTSLLYVLVLQSSQCSEVDQRIYFLQTWIIFENLYRCARDSEGVSSTATGEEIVWYTTLCSLSEWPPNICCDVPEDTTWSASQGWFPTRNGRQLSQLTGFGADPDGKCQFIPGSAWRGLNCCFAVACKVLLLFLRST